MKYYQFVLGCQQNYADGEKIAAILSSMGYQESSEEDADLIVVLACSVRQKAVDRIWGKIKKWKKQNMPKKYILCGCVLDRDKKLATKYFDSIIDSREISLLPKSLQAMNLPFENISEVDRLPVGKIGYVSIGVGCNNFCSYCAVPYTRGRETYFSKEQIIDEARDLIEKGCEEIMLLAQNVNSYKTKDRVAGKEVGADFVDLLRAIDELPGDFKISFLSPHPKDTSDELIGAVAELSKVKKEIHLPLQSGDDEILRKMNRHYKADDYLILVEKIRQTIPGIYLSTDIIVGFPTESDEQFQNTVKLCKKTNFKKAYISQYSPRSGTVSAKMFIDDVSKEEKKKRWEILNNLINK